MEVQEEYFYTCPFCFQSVSILVDKSVTEQSFIEDCEVCCRPTEFSIQITENEISSFTAKDPEQ